MKNRCKSKKKYGKLNIINVKLCYSAVFSNFAMFCFLKHTKH